jgi:hypothetical protein
VTIEAVEPIGGGYVHLRVRTEDGVSGETYLALEVLEAALAEEAEVPAAVDSRDVFRWVESRRIALAYAHDPYFAVSLSGVRGLPHQIEACTATCFHSCGCASFGTKRPPVQIRPPRQRSSRQMA